MFKQEIYIEKFRAKKYVSLDKTIYYDEVQPIKDRLTFFKYSTNIKDFYVPTGNKKIDEVIEILLDTIHFHLQFEDDVSVFSNLLPSCFTIGVK